MTKARAGAPHGRSRATLHALCLPLMLVPVGCRTFDDDRNWHRYPHYGSYRPYAAPPAPYVHQPVAPPVFVVPQRPSYIPPRPPERRFEPPHRDRPPHHSGGDRGPHLNRDSRPDHKRGR